MDLERIVLSEVSHREREGQTQNDLSHQQDIGTSILKIVVADGGSPEIREFTSLYHEMHSYHMGTTPMTLASPGEAGGQISQIQSPQRPEEAGVFPGLGISRAEEVALSSLTSAS